MAADAPTRSPQRQRVLVVDDHDVVHWGFRLMLTRQSWVERCLTASTGAGALELVARWRPHVAIVDLFIGEESGAEVCERIRAEEPFTRVLLFSGAGDISAHAARAAGASGFAHKDWPAARIAEATRIVGGGGEVFSAGSEGRPAVALGLTERERQVLTLMAGGQTNPEIARALHLSPHTVKEHTSSLYRKLEVRGRTEAVRRGQQLGLLA